MSVSKRLCKTCGKWLLLLNPQCFLCFCTCYFTRKLIKLCGLVTWIINIINCHINISTLFSCIYRIFTLYKPNAPLAMCATSFTMQVYPFFHQEYLGPLTTCICEMPEVFLSFFYANTLYLKHLLHIKPLQLITSIHGNP